MQRAFRILMRHAIPWDYDAGVRRRHRQLLPLRRDVHRYASRTCAWSAWKFVPRCIRLTRQPESRVQESASHTSLFVGRTGSGLWLPLNAFAGQLVFISMGFPGPIVVCMATLLMVAPVFSTAQSRTFSLADRATITLP